MEGLEESPARPEQFGHVVVVVGTLLPAYGEDDGGVVEGEDLPDRHDDQTPLRARVTAV